MRSVYSGLLYQLYSSTRLATGAYVAVNGPHDTYGVVNSSVQAPDGRWLNQVRGVKARAGERAVANL